MRLIARFLRDESGATSIEYCLIACGIAFALIAIVQTLGPTVAGRYTAVNTALQ